MKLDNGFTDSPIKSNSFFFCNKQAQTSIDFDFANMMFFLLRVHQVSHNTKTST